MMGLNSLDVFKEKKFSPSDIDIIHYIFWEKGIDLNAFNELPIPYIVKTINTDNYFKSKEEAAYKKANKK